MPESRAELIKGILSIGFFVTIAVAIVANFDQLTAEPTAAQATELYNLDVALRTMRVQLQSMELGKGGFKNVDELAATKEMISFAEGKRQEAIDAISWWERAKYTWRAWRLDSKAGL